METDLGIALSVVVITKNEELDLPGFLECFAQLADEIVIVDDGSTDRTQEIALSAGEKVRFFSCPRLENEGFCDQRQKGVNLSRGEWLLQVDADMRPTPELCAEVRRAILDGSMVAYRFRLEQYFMNKRVRYGGFQYWNQPWLSRRKHTSWHQKIHERIKLIACPDQIGQLSARMVHLGDIDFVERLRKNHLYSYIYANQMLDAGEKVGLLKLALRPLWLGFRSYVLMKGFLDGRVGFVWALYQVSGSATPLYLVWAQRNAGDRREIERRASAQLVKFVQR